MSSVRCIKCGEESSLEELIKDKDGDFVCPTCEGWKFIRIGDDEGEVVDGDELAEENDESLARKLEETRNGNTLRDYVIDYVLDDHKTDDEIISFFKDLSQYGCQSGMIGGLIYYSDTHKFFDEYYEEIEELREDYEDVIGQSLQVQGDMKNFYAWFGFEETAYRIASELELSI